MVTSRIRLRVLFCALASLCATALQAQVLILHSVNTSYASDVETKLDNSGLLAGGTTIHDERQSGTPTLAQLQQYKAVFVFSDMTFNNATALGDVLADYVDAGGGVVQATFTNFTGWPLAGRWESANYNPVVLSSYAPSAATLGTIALPSHSIMAGVSTLNSGGTYFASPQTLRSGATLVASWSDGAPLVVTNSNLNNRVVVLNMYPPSSDALSGSWTSSTDGVRLMANALNFVAIPEPSTWALLALGGGLLVLTWGRRRRS